MLQLPPVSQILDRAFGPAVAAGTDARKTETKEAAESGTSQPAGHLGALLDIDESIEPVYLQAAARQRQQDLRNRARVDAVLARLQAGDGVPAFHPQARAGRHLCFRHQNHVLTIASQDAFVAGQEPLFVLHLHGPGLIARHLGAWIENPDADFFEALDAACRGAQQAFIV